MTVVIGDATGHGLQAGMMVAATKSLFNALSHIQAPVQILKKISEALKAMGFQRMYMAMTIAKFKNNQIRISAAGMPYTLIYRAKSKNIEEAILKGMPLGSFPNFPYKQKTYRLEKGDTILFMSDGFPEMFNNQQEMLGEEQAIELFEKVAFKPSEQIITELVEAGKKWANGHVLEDDVTFIVMKMK